MAPLNIWIVEDDTGFRRTLQKLLNRDEHMSCDRVFPSCTKLFNAIATEPHPDLLLMDLGLPGMGGMDGIRKLSELAPNLDVVVLTVFADKEKVLESLDAGAAGYLLKSATPQEIIRGIQEVFAGGSALSPAVARVVLEEMRKAKPSGDFDLTPREVEVLEQLASGLSVKEIAEVLKISRSTVSGHLEKIYGKLNVQSQSGAVAKALRAGVI
jgi:DNA-binding NarL/FixJ family response regulator